MPDFEWHVMLGTEDAASHYVGVVEGVTADGITLAPLDPGEASERETFIRWDDVIYLMMSGPDRDKLLLKAADSWPVIIEPTP